MLYSDLKKIYFPDVMKCSSCGRGIVITEEDKELETIHCKHCNSILNIYSGKVEAVVKE